MIPQTGALLRLNRPDLFAHDDFQRWLRAGYHQHSRTPIATWHRGGEPNEYSDVFLVYDHELCEDISDDVNAELERLWRVHFSTPHDYGIIWISNLEE